MSKPQVVPDAGRHYAAWAAVIGALLAWANIGLYVVATGGDLTAMLKPATALALSSSAQQLFLLSMLFDSFGFYLPFLIIGGYLWARLRPRFGAPIDMATLCVGCYVLLGLAGTSMQMAALPPLAEAHAAGDLVQRAASETAWMGLVHAAQGGLWWMQGPLMAFWGIVVGHALTTSGFRLGLILTVCGVLYGVYFVTAFLGLSQITEVVQLIMLFLLPLWMLLTGLRLFRQPNLETGDI